MFAPFQQSVVQTLCEFSTDGVLATWLDFRFRAESDKIALQTFTRPLTQGE